MTDKEDIKEGMGKASTTDTVRLAISFAVGILLSRLLKRGLLTGEEVSLAIGFLPSLIYEVYLSYKRRYKQRQNIAVALKMPEGSSVAELKAVLNTAPPTAVLESSPTSVTVVKDVTEEKE